MVSGFIEVISASSC